MIGPLFNRFVIWWRDIEVGKDSTIAPGALLITAGGKISMGERCLLAHYAILNAQGGSIKLGNNASINSHSILYGFGGLEVGNDTRIGPHVTIMSEDHNYIKRSETVHKQGTIGKKTVIGNDVWIGSGSRILPGSQIGQGCVVGANSVVKGTLEPYSVYVGAPARKIKERLS